MKKILTNSEIYDISELYENYFKFDNHTYFPAKLNFCILKNFKLILIKKQEIDEARNNVIKHYGTVSYENKYSIDDENLPKALQELNELAMVTQELDIFPITLDDLSNFNLTSAQFLALDFMINQLSEASGELIPQTVNNPDGTTTYTFSMGG